MTAGELMEWQAYEQTFGSLLIHERIDMGFAQVSLILAKSLGSAKKATMRDFMPKWFQDLTADEELARGMAQLAGLVNEAD